MTSYVFLGPSLPVAEASQLFDAVYLPPVQQGDILRLLRKKPRFIGIVDGFFETVPAVWHKEILFALEAGTHVFGAASMGALRAAELHAFGMVGVGEVFEWYRDGIITADDEVAISHGPKELGYLPLNDTLVDIRDASRCALRDGRLTAALADELVAIAKAMPYRCRSFEAVAQAYCGCDSDKALTAGWAADSRTRGSGIKGRDTVALLHIMRDFAATDPAPKTFGYKLERTIFFEQLRNEVALESATKALDGEDPSLRESTIEKLRNGVMLRLLARQTAETFGWKLDIHEVSECAGKLCAELNLSEPVKRRAWMEANSISDDVIWRFVYDTLLIERLRRLHMMQIDEELAHHLLLQTRIQTPED